MLPLEDARELRMRPFCFPLKEHWCLPVQKVPYRKVLEDDGRGKQKVEVEQLAAWKLLMFSGSFSTRLYVFQDKRRGMVRSLPLLCCLCRTLFLCQLSMQDACYASVYFALTMGT